ncbi:MAG: glycosyltransferase [Ignavibacteriaceae bacterium]|nr:glycosyltransferase [Ignavibacteriaceae bacterium]
MVSGTNNPLVTVITITRNRASLLKRAILSVINQTYKNLEYIIIDGASEDNTSEVVNSFQDKRIIYIKQSHNKNISLSCDEAVQLSTGKYITFLDDDDKYLPMKIEKQVKLIESLPNDYGLVYCWMDYYDQDSGKMIGEHHPNNRGYIYYDCIEKQSMGGEPTLFMRREVYFDVNGWNKNLKLSSDWEFNTRIARKYLIDFVPEVLVHVYINHSFLRMTESFIPNSRDKIINLIEYTEYYLNEFKDGFQKYPEKKIPHLVRLAKLHARLGEINNCIINIRQLIREFGFNLNIQVTILKSIYFLISGYSIRK